MAWPPAALPTNRTNATPQQDTHPADHNTIGQAINDTTTKLQSVDTDVATLKAQRVAGPGGLLGLSERTTAAGPIAAGSPTGIAGVVLTLVLASRRMVCAEFFVRQAQTPAAGDYGFMQLRINGAVVNDALYLGVAGGGVNSPAIYVQRYIILAPGTQTFEVWAAPSVSTVTLVASASAPMFLAVTDYGDRP